ncbi:hypothetical protein [Rhodococcus artemisiae]|uniref:Uncharacterized protein n=1 Tax=Rhodococcus artemisiae TaxID=714159 RepID=A0ABU7L3A3_9NOCA|nr:hypothetical protein [Rhodococcus artemisiae]MEE2056016.1 hypothetical protein [Rhodococcus artemisiae]
MEAVEHMPVSPTSPAVRRAYLGCSCSTDERASNHLEPSVRADALEVLTDVDTDVAAQLPELEMLDTWGRAACTARVVIVASFSHCSARRATSGVLIGVDISSID